MKTTMHVVLALGASIPVLLFGKAMATDYSANRVVHHGQGVVVVPQFAVPVGVPIAEPAPSYYSYRTDAPAYQDDRLNRIEAALEQLIQLQLSGQQRAQALTPDAVVKQRCVSCHGGSNPSAGLDLSDFPVAEWDVQLRKKTAYLTHPSTAPGERMPKGKPSLNVTEFNTLWDGLMGFTPERAGTVRTQQEAAVPPAPVPPVPEQ